MPVTGGLRCIIRGKTVLEPLTKPARGPMHIYDVLMPVAFQQSLQNLLSWMHKKFAPPQPSTPNFPNKNSINPPNQLMPPLPRLVIDPQLPTDVPGKAHIPSGEEEIVALNTRVY